MKYEDNIYPMLYFTDFYSDRQLGVIALTLLCLSQGSLVNEHYSLSDVFDGDVMIGDGHADRGS